MRKTTEALHTGVVGAGNVKELPGSRVVALRGEKFFEYMSMVVLQRRFDTAQMALAQLLQHDTSRSRCLLPDEISAMVSTAYQLADELVLRERETLDAIIDRYWDLYMTRDSKTEEVMKTLVEESKDYTL